jgi:hypothetical protein
VSKNPTYPAFTLMGWTSDDVWRDAAEKSAAHEAVLMRAIIEAAQ